MSGSAKTATYFDYLAPLHQPSRSRNAGHPTNLHRTYCCQQTCRACMLNFYLGGDTWMMDLLSPCRQKSFNLFSSPSASQKHLQSRRLARVYQDTHHPGTLANAPPCNPINPPRNSNSFFPPKYSPNSHPQPSMQNICINPMKIVD